jgi:hypothetical protein
VLKKGRTNNEEQEQKEVSALDINIDQLLQTYGDLQRLLSDYD